MKKYTPYIKGLIASGAIMTFLTFVNLLVFSAPVLAALTLVAAYICFFAASMAPQHEKYMNTPLNPSHHDRSKRQS